MAKISELNDTQLDKAFQKYRSQYKAKPSPQLKKALLQIDAERKKRKGSSAKASPKPYIPDEPSPTQTVNLADLSQSASFLVDKSKVAKKKKEDKKLSNKFNKGQAPAISRNLTNILIGGGSILILIGLILILDHFLLEMLGYFPFKSYLAFFFVIIGTIMAKVATHLSDDNR